MSIAFMISRGESKCHAVQCCPRDCAKFCVSLRWHGHLGRVFSRAGSPCHRKFPSRERVRLSILAGNVSRQHLFAVLLCRFATFAAARWLAGLPSGECVLYTAGQASSATGRVGTLADPAWRRSTIAWSDRRRASTMERSRRIALLIGQDLSFSRNVIRGVASMR